MVVERRADHRVWQRTTYETGPNGVSVPKLHKYVECASGICRQDATGAWVDSQEQIEPYASGAVANQGQYQVIFDNNLNSEGAIDQQTTDAKRLRSNILGLAYYDRASGQSVVIAEVQDSQGELISANQVLYPNAFTGVKADVRYTYKKGSFEQDVILREQPPTPESLGLNSQSTEIEVLTEFLNPPAATISEHYSRNNSLPDQEVSWGAMRLGRGKVFDLGGPSNRHSKVQVRRQYETVNGRTILIEGVPLPDIQTKLQNLPLQSSTRTRLPVMIAKTPVLPKTPLAGRQAKPMKLAANAPSAKGFVLDYVELNTDQTDFTFQSDTTYLVDGLLTIFGTTTFEGGTVIKNDGSGQITTYTVNCQTTSYRPAIFTSINDDSVGESGAYFGDSSYNGNPNYNDVPLFLVSESSTELHNLRFCYTQDGVLNFADLDLWDCQFINVDNCACPYNPNLGLHNVLVNEVASDYPIYFDGSGNLTCENVTFDGPNGIPGLIYSTGETPTVTLTNCLITQIDQNNGLYEVSFDGINYTESASATYQTIGAGNYYLAPGSPYRGAGTTNVSPALLADLANKTTWPPTVEANATLSTATTLSPTVPRDNGSNGSLDLGYHYDPIDYLVGGSDLYASLTLTPGTVLAWYMDYGGVSSSGQPYALSLNDGASLTSVGTATAPCWIPRYNAVQEGVLGAVGWMSGLMFNGSGDPTALPQISAQFTKFSTSPDQGSFLRDNWAAGVGGFTHCEFYFGMADYWPSYYFTNCLFVRSGVSFGSSIDASSFTFQNCTFWQGALNPDRYSGQSPSQWTVLNTTFDGTTISTSDALNGNPNYTHFDYNAFIRGDNRLEILGPHDVVVSGAYNWQSSWFGDYYLPPNSMLIQKGSTTADKVGLYEFTTQTSQVKETNSVVDIGYHYVATDAYGNPLSTLWLGIPDYQVDTNGDGDEALVAWELEYFGQLGLDPNASWDGQGNTLLYDYQNGIYPDIITFTIGVTNNYVNLRNAPVQLNIADGIPGSLAVSVDDTNFATDANWQAYSGPNIAVNLGQTEGWHNVWVGLKGPAAGAPATWQGKRLKLDLTPPQLVITNPVGSTVSVPSIQLQGYSPEALSSIHYDLSNVNGLVTDQQVLILDQYYDTNTWEFTTNTFQAFDVGLTLGVNTITLHATDLAGNLTTTSFSYTLNYAGKTSPPVVQINWPQNGVEICGNTFTCNGSVSDPTSTITVQMVDANGDVNVMNAVVGRDGNFWAQNLPLSGGANYLTLTATDAAGNVSTTSLTVVQGDLGLNVDPVTAGQTIVTGEIDSSDYTVWVNGAEATDNDDGTWTAQIAPIALGGGTVEAVAIPNSDNGGNGLGGFDPAGNPLTGKAQTNGKFASQDSNGSSQSSQGSQTLVAAPEGDYISHYYVSETDIQGDAYDTLTNFYTITWDDGSGGSGVWSWDEALHTVNQYSWPTASWPQPLPCGTDNYTEDFLGGGVAYGPVTVVTQPPTLAMEQCNGISEDELIPEWNAWENYQRSANCKVKLATGGPAGSTKQNLWLINVTATAYHPPWLSNPLASTSIPSTNITILGKTLDASGNAYVLLPDNAFPDATPIINSPTAYYSFIITVQKYLSQLTVNVRQPYPNYPSDAVLYSWNPFYPVYDVLAGSAGHAWWELTSDAPINAINLFTTTNCSQWVGEQVGYAPSSTTWVTHVPPVKQGPGYLDTDNGSANITRIYAIGFQGPGLIEGLSDIENLYLSPGTWNSDTHNCVHETIKAGNSVGISLPNDIYPEIFGFDLPPSSP